MRFLKLLEIVYFVVYVSGAMLNRMGRSLSDLAGLTYLLMLRMLGILSVHLLSRPQRTLSTPRLLACGCRPKYPTYITSGLSRNISCLLLIVAVTSCAGRMGDVKPKKTSSPYKQFCGDKRKLKNPQELQKLFDEDKALTWFTTQNLSIDPSCNYASPLFFEKRYMTIAEFLLLNFEKSVPRRLSCMQEVGANERFTQLLALLKSGPIKIKCTNSDEPVFYKARASCKEDMALKKKMPIITISYSGLMGDLEYTLPHELMHFLGGMGIDHVDPVDEVELLDSCCVDTKNPLIEKSDQQKACNMLKAYYASSGKALSPSESRDYVLHILKTGYKLPMGPLVLSSSIASFFYYYSSWKQAKIDQQVLNAYFELLIGLEKERLNKQDTDPSHILWSPFWMGTLLLELEPSLLQNSRLMDEANKFLLATPESDKKLLFRLLAKASAVSIKKGMESVDKSLMEQLAQQYKKVKDSLAASEKNEYMQAVSYWLIVTKQKGEDKSWVFAFQKLYEPVLQ